MEGAENAPEDDQRPTVSKYVFNDEHFKELFMDYGFKKVT